jgi:hypothetical protein
MAVCRRSSVPCALIPTRRRRPCLISAVVDFVSANNFALHLRSRCRENPTSPAHHPRFVVLAFTVKSSNPSSFVRPPPHQLAPNTISSSFYASSRNPKKSGEDEASSAIFPKRSTNCLDRKIATDLADSCQLWKW